MTANDSTPAWQRCAAAQPVGQRARGRAVDMLLVVLIVGIVLFDALQSIEPVLAKVRACARESWGLCRRGGGSTVGLHRKGACR